MKKVILNDVRTPILIALCDIVCAFLLILGVKTTTDTLTLICLFTMFGTPIILNFVGFLLTFELIYFYEDKMVYLKLFRRTEMLYTQIVCIKETKTRGLTCANIADTWEITDNNQKTICIIREKPRRKIINQIKELYVQPT